MRTRLPKLLAAVVLHLFLFIGGSSAQAQTIIYRPQYYDPIANPDNYGAGASFYIWNAYTGAGDVTNSWEFLPKGYDPSDPSKKYPILFYFPGVGDVKTSDPNSVKFLGRRALPVEIEGGKFGEGFPFIVVGLQGTVSSPAADYAKFIEDYVFVKYASKIDFSRVYLTGLSMGGGRIMEYMADATRAAKIAAIAPVALGTGCPYIYGCGPGTAYYNIINNIAGNGIAAFFTHNQRDPTVPSVISADYVTGINGLPNGRAEFFFDPNNAEHDAWSLGYAKENTNFAGKNMYNWLAQFSTVSILPVVLSGFTASYNASGYIELKWATASESNSSHFLVERSLNGRDFTEIGRVNAAGNSTVKRDYAFKDADASSGLIYYRLKQVDRDGKFSYSAVRKLSRSSTGVEVRTSPNPFTNNISLTLNGPVRTLLNVTVTDASGVKLRSLQVQKNAEQVERTIDLTSLKPGIYILTVTGDNVNITQKIFKQL